MTTDPTTVVRSGQIIEIEHGEELIVFLGADLSRLWDGVALWVVLDEMRTETWPWPPWFSDLLDPPADR